MPRAKKGVIPEEAPRKTGRPTLFRPEYVEQARKLCAFGAINEELAEFFGVGLRTFKDWRIRYPEFAEACRLGKEVADQRVEDSLFKMATGYEYETTKLFVIDGQIVHEPVVEYATPTPSAAIFWLKNRRPDEWRDRQEMTGKDGTPLMPEVRVFLGRRPTEAEQGG